MLRALLLLAASSATSFADNHQQQQQQQQPAHDFVASVPPPPSSLPPHPRLILTPTRLATIKAAIQTDETAQLFYTQLLTHADWVVTQPVVVRPAPGPSGVLIPVRAVLDNTLTTALAYLLSNNQTYFDRAVLEAMNFCVNWTDWNPWQHTLDTGEAAAAMGLFYDWVYNDLTPAQRTTILMNGLVDRALTPFSVGYQNRSFFWVNNSINWNCVCAGGAMIGALAAYGENGVSPSLAWDAVLVPSYLSITTCASAYSPEGSWMEGIGYWGYASKYNVLAMTALNTSGVDDSCVSNATGLAQGGTFPAFMTAASAQLYDEADSEPLWVIEYGAPFYTTVPFAQAWGLRFGDEVARYYSNRVSAAFGSESLDQPQWGAPVEALLYFDGAGNASAMDALPTSKLYSLRQIGIFRSAWTDPVTPNATANSLHFKGGNNGWNHQHLDLGGFVVDFHGQRLAWDGGADNYNLPGYFGPQRWDYYRLNSLGHNVVKFNNVSQSTSAGANIVAFNGSTTTISSSSSSGAVVATADGWAVVDLTAAYAAQGLKSVQRGFAFLNGGETVVVADSFRVDSSSPAAGNLTNVTSAVHVNGTVTVAPDGQSATVQLDGQFGRGYVPPVTASVSIIPSSMGTSCAGAAMRVVPVSLPSPQYATPGIMRIEVVAPMGAGSNCTLLGIALGTPLSSSSSATGAVIVRFREDLGEWGALGPFVVAAAAGGEEP